MSIHYRVRIEEHAILSSYIDQTYPITHFVLLVYLIMTLSFELPYLSMTGCHRQGLGSKHAQEVFLSTTSTHNDRHDLML